MQCSDGGITGPLRLARGSHQAGSGKGCGANILSWEAGEHPISDFPRTVAIPLARLIHYVNDAICADPQPGDIDLLCPSCSMTVLDFAHHTVGTGGYDDPVLPWRWLREAGDLLIQTLTDLEANGPGPDERTSWYHRLVRRGGHVEPRMWAYVPAVQVRACIEDTLAIGAPLAASPTAYSRHLDLALSSAAPLQVGSAALHYHLPATGVVAIARQAVDLWHQMAGTRPAPVPVEVTERAVAAMLILDAPPTRMSIPTIVDWSYTLPTFDSMTPVPLTGPLVV